MYGSCSLSIFQMSLYNPSILQERIRALIVTQIDAFTGVPHDRPRAGIGGRTISHQLLKILYVVRRNCERISGEK